jgi:hypothetical protein
MSQSHNDEIVHSDPQKNTGSGIIHISAHPSRRTQYHVRLNKLQEKNWRERPVPTGNQHRGNISKSSHRDPSPISPCNTNIGAREKPPHIPFRYSNADMDFTGTPYTTTNATNLADKKHSLSQISSLSVHSYPFPSYSNLEFSETTAGELYRRIREIISDITPFSHHNMEEVTLVEYTHSVYITRNTRSTIFWKLWRLICPHLKDVEIYYFALRHGISASHCVRTHQVSSALPHRLLNENDTPPLYIRNTLFQEFKFDDILIDRFNGTYIREVKALLTRVNARGFLEHGGLAWRIALEFGTPSLWRDAFAGPSLSVAEFFEGDFRPSRGWICEAPLPREIVILIGGVYEQNKIRMARSLFPPLDLFENSAHWNGIWTADNEVWFGNLVDKIHRGCLKPRTRHDWDRWDRCNRPSLSERAARSCLNELELDQC